jgi:glycosyltransferase involved in cell wall biosynthesis
MIGMKVSVVIPVYNEEKRIKKCLDSLVNQSEKPDEIIVVDNNCTDGTIGIVKKYKEVTIVKESKQGILFARNAGFDRATGDVIARSDADTILPANWIKSIKQAFMKDKNIIALSTPVFVYGFGFMDIFSFFYYAYMFIPMMMMGHYPLVGPSMAIKRSIWEKVREELCTDQVKVHEDLDVSFHIKKLGVIYHDKKNLVFTSGRRMLYSPASFFGEYTYRFFKMYFSHRHLL